MRNFVTKRFQSLAGRIGTSPGMDRITAAPVAKFAAIALVSALTSVSSPLKAADTTTLNDQMQEGRLSFTPFGFKKFCEAEKAFCGLYKKARSAPEAIVELDDDRLEELIEINSGANDAISAVPELSFISYRDDWKIPDTSGDCEDFALLKQSRLIQEGWPESALLIAVVDTAEGQRHAVLLVRTNFGDLVLDSLTDKIHHWRKTDFKWIKRQSTRNMMKWVEIKIEKDKSKKEERA